MSGIVLGKHFNIGGREVYEDRVVVEEFATRGGLNLAVAIVADGVGGRDKGERAAQIAVDSVLSYLQESSEMDVPALLARAIAFANQQVYREAQRQGRSGMATTVAVAAILDRQVLFVANVGDSRIYLCRRQKLTQLTMDHTFANMMVWRGRMTPEEARSSPRASVVMRALGVQEQVQVDHGFYVGTGDYQIANERGLAGLPLEQGDAVLVCTDGLIKRSLRTGQPLIKEEEIITVLRTEEGDKAARTLVAFALGREPDDNVTAALLQMPDPARRGRKARRQRLIVAGVGVATAALLAVSGAVFLRFLRTQRTLEETAGVLSGVAATAARIAFEETAVAEIISARTPTPIPPTPTPRPAPVAGEVGAIFNDSTRTPIIEQQIIEAANVPALIVVNHREDLTDGNDGKIYILGSSTLALDSVTDVRISLSLSEGGDILLLTGRYSGGAQIRLEPSGVTFMVQGSCMSLRSPDGANISVVAVNCYEGSCSTVASFGSQPIPIETGQQMVFDTQALTPVRSAPIPMQEAVGHFASLVGFGEAGRADGLACLMPYLPPEPTSTPIEIPTFTPAPGGTTTPAQAGLGQDTPEAATTPLPQPGDATITPSMGETPLAPPGTPAEPGSEEPSPDNP